MKDKKDKNEMKTNWIWVLIVIIYLIILSLYFAVFHGSLSAISQDWASFGNYVSGTLTPILTAINIWVFIKLTKAVDANNKDRQKEELAFQKRKIITDLRKCEVDTFLSLWNNIGISDDAIERFNQLGAFQRYLMGFCDEKLNLFPCIVGELKPLISKLRTQLTVKSSDTIVNLSKAIEIKGEIIIKLNNYMIENI